MKMVLKRCLSLLLCIMLAIIMLPVNVFANAILPADLLSGGDSAVPSQLSAMSADSTAGNTAGQSPVNNAGSGAIEFDNPFGDVKPGDWFFDDVKFVYTSGLMTGIGTEPLLFSPDMPMSRAMLVTVLYRLAGAARIPPACPTRLPTFRNNRGTATL